MFNLYITCDHAGWDLKSKIVSELNSQGIGIVDLVSVLDPNDDYPNTAKIMALKIKKDIDNDIESFGVAICGSGQGICMAMNRFGFIRAAQPRSEEESIKTREHNNSNVICFGCNTVEFKSIIEIIKTFVSSPFSNGLRHQRRISIISSMDYTLIV